MKMNAITTISERLLPVLIFFLVFCSCEQEKDIATVKNEGVHVRLLLHTADMTVASSNSATRVNNGIMDAYLGQPSVTRAASALTTEEEAKVKSLSYFEFSGTTDGSRCVKKGYVSSVTGENIAALTLTSSTDLHKVYVVANLGDVTKDIIEDASGTPGTLLSTFKERTYSFNNDTDVATAGLPMIGSVDMIPNSKNGNITLNRLVARINVICNVNVPLGESFVCQSMQMKNVSNIGKYTSSSNYPDNTFASYFSDYSLLNTNSGVWYIPENRRGTVSNTMNALKNTIAPSYSTCVDMTGIYTHAGIKKEVTYRIYLGGNMVDNFDILANTSYTLYITVKGYNESDGYVLQLVTDLSQNPDGVLETANSYIVRDGGKSYKFNATIMGNGKRTPAATIISPSNIIQNAPAITPAPLSPTNALVLWETGSKGSVIEDGSVTLGVDGYVRFKTANNTTNGNAVIAVRDAANNILWSWHIWKVPYNPNSDYDTYNIFGGRSFKMMKYNLGAIEIANWSGTAANAGDLGLFYQWGRKDPFVGASGWTNTLQSLAYASGYERKVVLNTNATVGGYSGANATIQYAVLNPTHFISTATTGLYGEWLNSPDYADKRDNLWGNPIQITTMDLVNPLLGSKSIYDPCPPGWRVPAQDAYLNFSTKLNTGNKSEFNVVNLDIAANRGYSFYYNSFFAGPSAYYPALGALDPNSGNLTAVAAHGNYWCSSSILAGSGTSVPLHFNRSYLGPIDNRGRAFGFSVRCSQE